MYRIPILQMGRSLLVTIQMDVEDQTALALQDDLADSIIKTGANGVLIDISASPFAERLIAIGGSTGRLIAELDWSSSGVEAIATWPQGLRTAVTALLVSPLPSTILWGADGVMFHNDAYLSFARDRHPQLLGRKVREGWPEISEFSGNVMNVVLSGRALTYRDEELTLIRHGCSEQVFVNLVMNAIQAMGNGGTLTVRTSKTRLVRSGHDEGSRSSNQFFLGDTVVLIDNLAWSTAEVTPGTSL